MPLRMAGQYADEEVGLFYNYFRFYDPATGRYIKNDPIDLQGGLNRYGYVGGSPLHYVDPYGLLGIGAKTGAIAGGIAGGILGGIVCIPTGPFALACGAEGVTIGATAGFAFGMAVGNLSDIIGIWLEVNESDNISQEEICPADLPEKIPDFDFNDPTKNPIDKDGNVWNWHGKPPQGGKFGAYKNPKGPESLHPDLSHSPPIGPHWDFNDRKSKGYRVFPDGSIRPK